MNNVCIANELLLSRSHREINDNNVKNNKHVQQRKVKLLKTKS